MFLMLPVMLRIAFLVAVDGKSSGFSGDVFISPSAAKFIGLMLEVVYLFTPAKSRIFDFLNDLLTLEIFELVFIRL